jgi:hypothetical protein
MKQIDQRVMEGLRSLPPDKQQEVLDFVEFLRFKVKKQESPVRNWQPGVSALVAAEEFVGCVEGPEDLSTNKKYMEGFGE